MCSHSSLPLPQLTNKGFDKAKVFEGWTREAWPDWPSTGGATHMFETDMFTVRMGWRFVKHIK